MSLSRTDANDFANGAAPARPRRQQSLHVPLAVPSTHRPLTPVCSGCRYPLVCSDHVCPRCRAAVPWTLNEPQGKAVGEGEGAP